MRRVILLALAVLVSIAASTAFAQGRQWGAISGRVFSADRLSIPGATVTVTSPALQGERSAVTDTNGNYSIPELPPGEYLVTFALDGWATSQRRAAVPLGGTLTIDQPLEISPVEVGIDVRAATPAPVTSPAGAFNLRARRINQLPIGRTPFLTAEFAPGLTDNTPSQSQVTISGAFAYDNVFLLNGVDVNDNVLGQPNNLFIEDAVEEVQVLTSGLSAEYGRFSGGVVSVLTKSGGNQMSGGFRFNLTNPSWADETPFEDARGTTRKSKLSPTYEATLGGPILRDRLWFFAATRVERTTTQSSFAQTGIPFTSRNNNARYEGKLTATPRPAHTFQGTYVLNQVDLEQPSLGVSIDPATFTTPSTPNHLLAASWRGVLGRRAFATVQYSQKDWKLENAGGASTAIADSPFLTRGVLGVPGGLQYNGPYFDSTDPEQRNNRQLTGSMTYLAARPTFGSHEVKGGFEYFASQRVGGNSQSASGYVFQTDYKVGADGRPALDANGRLIPRFVPGTSRLQTWMPLRGATIDVTTVSLFVTDHWKVGPRLTLDLGVRHERASSDATGDISGADGVTTVPRLAASYALTADHRTVVQATYGHYAGKYNDVQFSRNTNVGNADRITGTYNGPAGEGRDFAAGLNPANYATFTGTFPTANVFFDEGLSSPLTKEFTISFGRELNARGWARATYVNRRMSRFVEDFITIDGGTTRIARNGIDLGLFDNQVYRNSDDPKRRYQAVELQASYDVFSRLSVAGHWTVQIENDGTFEGEGSTGPALPTLIGDYPELYVPARNFPDGRLDDFQRHKVRLWAAYSHDLGRFGQLDLAPLYRFNSGRTYSLAVGGVPLSSIQLARNPGYARLPSSQTIFFGERGAESFKGAHLMDLATTYTLPIWGTLRPWVKLEVLNLLNNQTLVNWNTTIAVDPASPKDENGLPTGYIKGATFGTASGNASYPRPRPGIDGGRTFIVAAGVRF